MTTMTTMKAEDVTRVVATQSVMSQQLAEQSLMLTDISKTLAGIHVVQATQGERLMGILENNQRRDNDVLLLSGRVRKLENITALNKFALNFYPQVVIIIAGVFVFAFGVGMGIVELIG